MDEQVIKKNLTQALAGDKEALGELLNAAQDERLFAGILRSERRRLPMQTAGGSCYCDAPADA